MVPSNEDVEVSCSRCEQYFCEEIPQSVRPEENPMNFYRQQDPAPSSQ